MIKPIQVFNSTCRTYQAAFEVFLKHTNQKQMAYSVLQPLVASLPERKQMLDIGAGDGTLTSMVYEDFDEVLAFEPNEALVASLQRRCPGINILPKKIDEVNVGLHADLIVCSHVLYYVDKSRWMQTLDKLASWLKPNGVLVCILQNPSTDCMRMVEYLYQDRFDLAGLAQKFDLFAGHRFQQTMRTLPSYIETSDLESAYTIAELVLNVVPMRDPVPRDLLVDHVNRFFRGPDGTYHFSCNQDFLIIKRR